MFIVFSRILKVFYEDQACMLPGIQSSRLQFARILLGFQTSRLPGSYLRRIPGFQARFLLVFQGVLSLSRAFWLGLPRTLPF